MGGKAIIYLVATQTAIAVFKQFMNIASTKGIKLQPSTVYHLCFLKNKIHSTLSMKGRMLIIPIEALPPVNLSY